MKVGDIVHDEKVGKGQWERWISDNVVVVEGIVVCLYIEKGHQILG